MGLFQCTECKETHSVPRRYAFYLSKTVRCPLCGTYRLRALAEPDRIDRVHKNPMTFLYKLIGAGRMYHCRYCRIQFYDRRPLAEPHIVNAVAASTTQQ